MTEPSLADALLDLPAVLEPVVKAQLELVRTGVIPEAAFWASWSAMTGRPVPDGSHDESGKAQRDWPAGLDPADMPTYLAHPWAALCSESHPRVRLHWLVDTAELIVRWVVAVALSEVIGNRGQLPEGVAHQIRDHIERPTLGRWLGILRSLSEARPAQPLLAPAIFELYQAELEPRFRQETDDGSAGHLEDSLLGLRNKVAHGGGMSRMRAQQLLDVHLPRLQALLKVTLAATAGVTVVAVEGGKAQRLFGLTPVSTALPEGLSVAHHGPWLVGDAGVLPLLPLAHYGPVRRVDGHGTVQSLPGSTGVQLYARGSRDRLAYTPLGRDEAHSVVSGEALAEFRALFQLDAGRPTRKSMTVDAVFAWDDFLREARVLAEDLVGRADELKVVKGWLRARKPRDEALPRLGWISGGPGVGKSMVMAKLATTFAQPRHRGLFYHRFRGGDSRNSRRSFLRLLQSALWAWEPLAALTQAPTADARDGQGLEEDVKARLAAVAGFDTSKPNAPPPAFWVFADGLDEAVSNDPGLPVLLRRLALPGTVWLVAGRPEHGLERLFSGAECEPLFPQGLPAMKAADIRAMLLEGLGNARYALLKRDEDADDGVHNIFIEQVAQRAHGLPLYVHLLLEDLRAGHLSIHAEDRLPDGLTAYYDDLVNRHGLSAVKADLTHIVCLLARAEEPLDAAGLALLLGGATKLKRYLPRVEAALRVGQALLRPASSPETDTGWTLYHQSFRDYVGGRSATRGTAAAPPAAALAESVTDAEERLFEQAVAWSVLDEPASHPLRNHLFRWGTEYALWWQGDAGVRAVRGRLTDFAYLQARTAALPAQECTDLTGEYERVLKVLPEREERASFSLWETFMRERAHLLRRGSHEWPANKILLQLAVEHADESPVTVAAEAWLADGHCEWIWFRRARRVVKAAPSPCLRVFEGHTSSVIGAMVLPNAQVLSWSWDTTLRLWDLSTASCLATFEGHTARVEGAAAFADGRLVSWSGDDGSLRLWEGATGRLLAVQEDELECVVGALALPDGRVLSWWDEGTLSLWGGNPAAPPLKLVGHDGGVTWATALPEGRILSWGQDSTIRLWDGASGEALVVFEGQTAPVIGATLLPNERVLSWDEDDIVRVWDVATGAPLHVFGKNTPALQGAQVRVLPGGRRVLSRDDDGTVRLWNALNGVPLAVLDGEPRPFEQYARYDIQVIPIPDGALLLYEDRHEHNQFHVWDGTTGELVAVLKNHGLVSPPRCAISIPGRQILGWNYDDTRLHLWDRETAGRLAVLEGHTGGVHGASAVPDGRALSWSDDGTMRLWNLDRPSSSEALESHHSDVRGTDVLLDGRVISWASFSNDTFRIWDPKTGALSAIGETDEIPITGLVVLSDGRVLSWSKGWGILRLWEVGDDPSAVGVTIRSTTTLRGHESSGSGRRWYYIRGVTALSDGRLLSWSSDGTLRLWDGHTGAPLTTLRGHTGGVRGATALADGRLLSWSSDGTLRIWDGHTGAPLAMLQGHTDEVSGAEVLADGRLLSWSVDGTLRLWDSHTGAPFAILQGSARWATSVKGVTALADGRLLSWSADGTLQLWDRNCGAPLVTLLGHTGSVHGVTALADGRLLSWSGDGTLRTWDGHTGAPLDAMPMESAWLRHPGVHHAWCVAARPENSSPAGSASGHQGSVVLAMLVSGRGARWDGDGDWEVSRLLPDGTVVASCNGDLAFLKLHYGSRRVTLDEAAALLSPASLTK